MLPVPIVNIFEGGAPLVYRDAYAAPDTGCQSKASDLVPPTYPLNVQGALQLHSGHEQEMAEILLNVNQLKEIVHLCNSPAEQCCRSSKNINSPKNSGTCLQKKFDE